MTEPLASAAAVAAAAAPSPSPTAAEAGDSAAVKSQQHILLLQMVAGSGAGAVAKTATAPLERIKIIFQVQVRVRCPRGVHTPCGGRWCGWVPYAPPVPRCAGGCDAAALLSVITYHHHRPSPTPVYTLSGSLARSLALASHTPSDSPTTLWARRA